jgi:NitT/TauT family transport system ATP-binding protein
MDIICSVENVSQSFSLSTKQSLEVLKNISFDIYENEVVSILGPSGSGKSTLLRMICGILKPSSGSVFYKGKLIDNINPNVSMVFQNFALLPWLNVEENIKLALKPLNLDKNEIAKHTETVIRITGLTGFEEAYPKELSGGMQQRVGVARALAVQPELLLMDEPFSHVDTLVAESLRSELIDIWQLTENPKSILIVSHDIKEVVYLSDKIILLGGKPTQIKTIIENKLPRPRDYRSIDFLNMVDYIHDIITASDLPDIPEAIETQQKENFFEALPDASPGEIVGLLEFLDSHGGYDDIFHIAVELNREFGDIIKITKAAELLDFVDTPKRSIVFTTIGRRFIESDIEQRKQIWKKEILDLRLVRHIFDMVKNSDKEFLYKEDIINEISNRLPQEDPEKIFKTFVSWTRFADLLAYDSETEEVSLQ